MRTFLRQNKLLLGIIALFAVLAVVFAGTSAKANVNAPGQDKVQVCHALGNGSYNLLEVPQPALQAHLDHGDVLPTDGVCPQPEEPPVDEPPVDQPPVDEPAPFEPVTVVKRWLLAEGSAKGSAYAGGPQTVYNAASCGNGIIQVDAYVALSPEDFEAIEALDDDGLLHQGEDRDITKSWSWENQTPCEEPNPDTELPVCLPGEILTEDLTCVPGDWFEPETPVTPEVVNPEAVTGGTPESVQALPQEQREFVEQYAAKHGIAPEDVLIEMG